MNLRKALSIALAATALGACSLVAPTRPSQFYVLSPEPGAPLAAPASAIQALRLGIGPIDLPDEVNRPQIVTRPEANRIHLDEFHRWGGDLGKDLERVLAQNLIARLNTDSVVYYPWQRREAPDVQIAVRFFRFDGRLDGQAKLAGVWQLSNVSEGCVLRVQRFDISQDAGNGGYRAFVAALSAGVGRLSEAIARAVVGVGAGCSVK